MEEHLAIGQDAGELAVDADVRDIEHRGMRPSFSGSVSFTLVPSVPKRVAKATCSSSLEVLAAEEDDAVLLPGAADAREILIVRAAAEIDAATSTPIAGESGLISTAVLGTVDCSSESAAAAPCTWDYGRRGGRDPMIVLPHGRDGFPQRQRRRRVARDPGGARRGQCAARRRPMAPTRSRRGWKRGFAELFEHEVAVFPVATGTAANALALATLTPPWGVIYCHEEAHVAIDECGAPEFFSGGAKIVALAGRRRQDHARRGRGAARPSAASSTTRSPRRSAISQTTEAGTVYRPPRSRRSASSRARAGLALHIDGARFANAVAALDCAPADITWRAGVDVLSFGATKNGALAAEAVIFFDPDAARDLGYRRKRGGHLFRRCASSRRSSRPISRTGCGSATRATRTPWRRGSARALRAHRKPRGSAIRSRRTRSSSSCRSASSARSPRRASVLSLGRRGCRVPPARRLLRHARTRSIASSRAARDAARENSTD